MATPSLLDQQCELKELCNHARTAKWYELGIQLELSDVDLDNIQNNPAQSDKITAMYKLWINTKGQHATHRKLIIALKSDSVKGTNIAQKYEEWLKTKVARNEGIEQTISSAVPTCTSRPKDKPEHGSVTQSGHHQVNVSGVTAGGNITIHMAGQKDDNPEHGSVTQSSQQNLSEVTVGGHGVIQQGIVAEEDVYKSDLPDHVLDQQPTIQELSKDARTADWNKLGVELKLDSVALAGCNDCTSMYQLWLMEKAREATRRNLLNALHALKLNAIIQTYEDHLKKKFRI